MRAFHRAKSEEEKQAALKLVKEMFPDLHFDYAEPAELGGMKLREGKEKEEMRIAGWRRRKLSSKLYSNV